jgi:hypothetical protein
VNAAEIHLLNEDLVELERVVLSAKGVLRERGNAVAHKNIVFLVAPRFIGYARCK